MNRPMSSPEIKSCRGISRFREIHEFYYPQISQNYTEGINKSHYLRHLRNLLIVSMMGASLDFGRCTRPSGQRLTFGAARSIAPLNLVSVDEERRHDA